MNPKAVLSRLEAEIGINGSPRRLRDAIEFELKAHFGVGILRSAELAEQLEIPVRKLIEKIKLEKQQGGALPILALSSITPRTVMGSCWVEPSDLPEVTSAKLRRLHVEPLLNEIKSLTFNEFEVFGARVLKELGASIVRVTPHADDQGIDFYGVLSIGALGNIPTSFSQLAHDVKIRFAGQAKHYPNSSIGPNIIRELVGAISLARYKLFTSKADLFEDLELLAFNPLLAMIFTTGRFTSGARELTRKAGIIARSGEQLAVFLADRGVGMQDAGGVVNFDSATFRLWLTSK
jgi:hypothetical protein